MKIQTVDVNDFGGTFSYRVVFNQRLNLICGENGTGKTRLLQQIKEGRGITTYENEHISNINQQVFALSPKRNSQRQEIESVIQQMRRDNRGFQFFINDSFNKHFNNNGFDNYSSFVELFMYYFENLDRAGGDRREAMAKVATEFNEVMSQIFSDYRISATWDEGKGLPSPVIEKRNKQIPIMGLSCGENELFSLILNLYSTRGQFDIYLIDEPEVHLNWHLERQLFDYLLHFSETYDKQVVIATHSRIVFNPRFRPYVKCLYWDRDKVVIGDEVPQPIRTRLAEEAATHIKLGNFSQETFFIEDDSHEDFLTALAEVLGKEICLSQCGTSSNVKSLLKLAIADGGWDKSYFLIDGDNMGTPKLPSPPLIHLAKYCIENYGLSYSLAEAISGKKVADIVLKIFELIKKKRQDILNKNMYLDFLFDRLQPGDLSEQLLDKFDASCIFIEFIEWLGFKNRHAYWKAYLGKANGNQMLESIVPKAILDVYDYRAATQNEKEISEEREPQTHSETSSEKTKEIATAIHGGGDSESDPELPSA